jgi:ceramide glucosyltransferase
MHFLSHFICICIYFCIYSSLAYYLAACAAGLCFARESARPAKPLAGEPPSVLLLRPLHGFSDQMLENVRNLLDVDYPDKKFVLGATSEQDGSTRIVRTIERERRSSDIVVTVGQSHAGNPKVGKLMWMLNHAPEAEILVMSDADCRVQSDHVRRLVGELSEDKVGLVTCIYCGKPATGDIGARMEALFINTDFAPIAILSKYIESARHAYASCIAIRKSVLNSIGGLHAVKDCFGDDLMLARNVAAAGYRIKVSSALVTITAEEKTVVDFWRHQLRGWRVDRRIRPISLGRILLNGSFWALALLLVVGFSMPTLKLAAGTLAARLLMSAVMTMLVFKLPFKLIDAFLVPFKDLLLAGIWAASLTGNTVEWGGRQRRLTADGKMQEVSI